MVIPAEMPLLGATSMIAAHLASAFVLNDFFRKHMRTFALQMFGEPLERLLDRPLRHHIVIIDDSALRPFSAIWSKSSSTVVPPKWFLPLKFHTPNKAMAHKPCVARASPFLIPSLTHKSINGSANIGRHRGGQSTWTPAPWRPFVDMTADRLGDAPTREDFPERLTRHLLAGFVGNQVLACKQLMGMLEWKSRTEATIFVHDLRRVQRRIFPFLSGPESPPDAVFAPLLHSPQHRALAVSAKRGYPGFNQRMIWESGTIRFEAELVIGLVIAEEIRALLFPGFDFVWWTSLVFLQLVILIIKITEDLFLLWWQPATMKLIPGLKAPFQSPVVAHSGGVFFSPMVLEIRRISPMWHGSSL
jgi:hypothetical protein